LTSNKYAALIALVAVVVALVAWFADPIWRVLVVATVAAIVWLDAACQARSQSSRGQLDRLKGLPQQAIEQLAGNFQSMNSLVQDG